MSGNRDDMRQVHTTAAPVTILDWARHRGVEAAPDGSISAAEFHRVGLPFMGGCFRCGATVAAYNSGPTTSGFIACVGCIGDDGFATPEDAEAWCGGEEEDDE